VEIQDNFGTMYAGRFRCRSLKTCKGYPRRSFNLLNTDSLPVTTRGRAGGKESGRLFWSRESCANVGLRRLISLRLSTPRASSCLYLDLERLDRTELSPLSSYIYSIAHSTDELYQRMRELLNTRGSDHVARPTGLLQLITQRRISESSGKQ
jgi:hypothetical protein